jgi:cbb3-type cytochrome oxidase subunit 3
MRLSDIMSHAGLAGYAEVGLIIFFVVFLAIAARVFSPVRTPHYDAAARMPLDDDRPVTPRHGAPQ